MASAEHPDNPRTAALIRALDWSATALGPRTSWPAELETLVRLMLRAKTPQHLVWGPEQCLVYNDGYIPLLEDKHPGAMGRPFAEAWPEVWDEMGPIVERTYAGEASYFEDHPLTLRRGATHERAWISFAYTPVEADDGRVLGFHCQFFETTAKVLAERRQLEESERLRRMFEQAPGFIGVLAGPEHVFELSNDAYHRLVGNRPMIGLTVREALPEVIDQGFIQLLDRVYASGQPYIGRRVPITLRREDGAGVETRYLDFVYQPLIDAEGHTTGIFIQGSDVTDHRLAEDHLRSLGEELRLSNQRKDEFLATLAHELRNPLAPIRTGLSVLALSPPAEKAAQTREVMGRQLAHLVRLVDDLLDIARINSNKIELRRQRVAVADIVQAALEVSRPAIDAEGHALFVSQPARDLYVDADPTRIAQVISNLLNNAAKYTPAPGRIELSVAREEDMVAIRVRDDGIGIESAALPDLFALFSQVERTQVQSQGGLGIGLALVRRMVEMHGGTAMAESEGVGRGATFSIRLPIAAVAATEVPETPAPVPPANAAPMHILVVDDNVDAAETMRSLLELLGHEVEVAHDGPAALAAIEASHPRLVFLDIGLPGMDGYEVARRVRASPHCADTVLAALTGWGAPSDLERSRESGIDHHLTKPVDPDAIAAMVTSLQREG